MRAITTLADCVSFGDVLAWQGRCRPEQEYIHDGNTGMSHTFAEVDGLVDRAVGFLHRQGCRPGDFISAILNNRLEYVVLYFAALRSGIVFSPFPFNMSPGDLDKYLRYIGPKLVFCQDRHAHELREKKWCVHLIEDFAGRSRFLDELPPARPDRSGDYVPSGGDIACVYYSSGTTDNPKGIAVSHDNMIANISSIVRGFGWTNEDCHLIFLPLGHTASINYSFLPCTYCGARFVLFESFWKIRNLLWDHVEKFGVTYMEVVPSTLYAILNTEYKEYRRERLKKFKYIGCGSAPFPVAVQQAIEEKFDLRAANLYGLSETGPTHIDNPLEPGWKPGSIGYPLDVNDVKILNGHGDEVKTGEVGEIAVKGPNVFAAYYKNEKAYAAAFRNGFRVGVIGLPVLDLMFWAVEGGGAFCNGEKKSVSANGDLAKSMVAYDNQFYLEEASFGRYRRLVEASFTTRITGSAVYDLCLM